MFKLIGVRPLKGCRQSILKCLKEGQMYYLCNDYIVADDKVLSRDYTRPLPLDFFSLEKNPRLQVNISAIVGMNGYGKSSLVELIMRLINNLAIHINLMGEPNSLLRVEGVKAELFYECEDVIYRIKEEDGEDFTCLQKYAVRDSNNSGGWKTVKSVEYNRNVLKSLFYTVVSNYSQYSYNTNDFREDWSDESNLIQGDERCWLHYLFHKNDGYIAPMTIYPFREEGNIDVNLEKELTIQRLIALYIQEPNPQNEEHSFRRIGEKDANILVLTDVGESFLQTRTILQSFMEYKDIPSFLRVSRFVEVMMRMKAHISEDLLQALDRSLSNMEEELDPLTGSNNRNYRAFLDQNLAWIDSHKDVISNDNNLGFLFRRLSALSVRLVREENSERAFKYSSLIEKYRKYEMLTASQLARLRLIFIVMKEWGAPLGIVCKNYDELSDVNRCWHYIIYKTINIISTYPQYRHSVDFWGGVWDDMQLLHQEARIRSLISRIREDKSHITLKLRQCWNYIANRGMEGTNVYESLDRKDLHKKVGPHYDSSLVVSFDDVKDHFQKKPFPLDLLPPPIYKAEILYQRNDQEKCIPFCSLSSGEKQLLNSFGALLYHLRNIDSGNNYENVNVFLEEIELYFHPESQQKMVRMLVEKLHSISFARIKRVNIVFVTHSPFILSDIPLCNVLFLKDGRPSMAMQEDTFGANIHGLLRNGFFLPSLPIGEFAFEKINTLFEIMNRFKIDRNDKEMAAEIYSYIMRVGEPYLREQLMSLYNMHYPINSSINPNQ